MKTTNCFSMRMGAMVVHSISILLLILILFTHCSKVPTGPDRQQINGSSNSAGVAQETHAANCQEGIQPSGALYQICLPEEWNGELVVYAHGYVNPQEPIALPDDEVDGTPLSEIITDLGYAYATTSYRDNGLVVPQAIEDLVELVNELFIPTFGEPEYVYLVGASEGGLITAKSVEMFPETFDGGLAACGPVGDFRKQLNYFGDFLVVFNYFFPGVLPGCTPEHIPQEVMENWSGIYAEAVKAAIAADPHAAEQVIAVTRAAVDPNDPSSIEKTFLGVLWYNVFATNDAIEKLGGVAYDNSRRIYVGSDDDITLNREIERYHADPAALEAIEADYQTTGELTVPVVTLHTLLDEIVPYWHEPLYRRKILMAGSGELYLNIPIPRYGHCNFEVEEVLAAFAALVFKVKSENVLVSGKIFRSPESQKRFLDLARRYGSQPLIAAN